MFNEELWIKLFFSIKISKTEFSFLINGSEISSKYQRIHFNKFHDKTIVANNFTKKEYLRVQNSTQQMTNDGRSFALPINVKKSDLKGFCGA